MKKIALAVACATALGAAPASAATLRGTVVGEPVVREGRTSVPVLPAGATAVVKVRAREIRSDLGPIAADRLRLGDMVRATVRRGGRTASLRVLRRGGAPSFRDLAARGADALAGAQRALDEVARLNATASGIAGAQAVAPGELRARLIAVRTELNLLISDLRRQADALDGVVASVPARASGTAQKLGAVAAAARTAAQALQDAVTRLDAAINDVGGASAPSIPIETVSVASAVIHDVLELLRDLPGGANRP